MNFEPYFENTGRGGYVDMGEQEYRALPAVNASTLVHATPAEMYHSLTEGSGETNATGLGTLIHIALLEPWKFGARSGEFFALCPTKGLDTKAAQETRAANPGKVLVTEEMLEIAKRIRHEAIETSAQIMEFLNSPDGKSEAACVTFDPEFLIRRKIRVDYLPMRGAQFGSDIVDIKTTSSPLFRFENEAWKHGYYKKAAYYLDTHELATGHRPERFVWIVITTKPPYMARVFYMQNLHPGDPLYPESKLRIARESLGLDKQSKRIGSLSSFVFAAQEHMQALREGDKLDTPAAIRRIWTGYEDETPMQDISLMITRNNQ